MLAHPDSAAAMALMTDALTAAKGLRLVTTDSDHLANFSILFEENEHGATKLQRLRQIAAGYL
jgi:hypothetical protein